MLRLLFISLTLLFFCRHALAKDKRSRGENLPGISSSNTVGLGNIFITGGVETYFASVYQNTAGFLDSLDPNFRSYTSPYRQDFFVSPRVNGVIGLMNFLDFEVSSIPWTGEKIGVTIAKLRFTLPGNDNLRMFGFGGTVDVTLSTEEDALNVHEETPAFDPIISFSGIADIDFIKRYPKFPLKIYLNYANLDNYRLHKIYSQHNIKTAFELKRETSSVYLKASTTFYSKKDVDVDTYENTVTKSTVGFGYRKRFSKTIPFTITIDCNLDPTHPFGFWDSDIYESPAIYAGVDIPIFFKETNTEALRTLIYLEQTRKSQKQGGEKGRIGKIKASALSLERLKLENKGKNMLDDKQLNSIFSPEEDKDLEEKRKRIYEDLKKNEKE